MIIYVIMRIFDYVNFEKAKIKGYLEYELTSKSKFLANSFVNTYIICIIFAYTKFE